MEDWQQEMYRQFEQWADEAEQFWTEATQAMLDTIDEACQLSEAIAKDIEDIFWEELGRLEEWFGSPADPGSVYRYDAHIEYGFDHDPDLADFRLWRTPAVCANCRHYHGQMYGGTMLICGMHPYGPGEEATSCSDREVGLF